jgi:hypothetical protein
MKNIVATLLMLSALPAFAGNPIAKQGDDSVRLTQEPCSHEEILPKLNPELAGYYFTAQAKFGGQDFTACWTLQGGQVLLQYADGDQGIIPVGEFKDEDTGVAPPAPTKEQRQAEDKFRI